MKFQPDSFAGRNAITRLEEGALWVNAARHEGALLVPWRGDVVAWAPTAFDAVQARDFEAVLALRPELVIFGSGARHRFVAPALYRALIEVRIGLEAMDTAAACRTFNVLASEGRSVVAALLPGGAA